jgi:hypothetical protein
MTLGAREYGSDSCDQEFDTSFCRDTASSDDTSAAVGLVFDGLIQAGGLAVFIAGLVVKRERVVPVYTLAPLPVKSGAGLQVVGSF